MHKTQTQHRIPKPVPNGLHRAAATDLVQETRVNAGAASNPSCTQMSHQRVNHEDVTPSTDRHP